MGLASFDWTLQVDLNMALEQQERLTELVDPKQLVVKTATLEEVTDLWPSWVLRQRQSLHSGMILASESGLSLSLTTPMPASLGKTRCSKHAGVWTLSQAHY